MEASALDAAGLLEIEAVGPLDEERALAAPVLGVHLGGSLPPLLMIRTWITEIDNLRALARALGPEQPIYSLAPPAGSQPEDYPENAEAWSDFCLARLKLIPRQSFAWIGGWSFGGVVALEMAEQLAEKGETIRLVAMLDTRFPKRHPRRKSRGLRKSTKLYTLSRHLSQYVELETPEEKREFLRARARRRVEKIQNKAVRTWKRLRGQPYQRHAEDMPTQGEDGVYEVRGRRMSLLQYTVRVCYLKYRRDHSSLPVAQLWTRESLRAEGGDASLGWAKRLRGELDTAPVPGGHTTMFEDAHVEAVARQLARALRRASA